MKKGAAKINISDILGIGVKTHVTMWPKTPVWTDRSWNGKGFFALDLPEQGKIDTSKMEDTPYKRHHRRQ